MHSYNHKNRNLAVYGKAKQTPHHPHNKKAHFNTSKQSVGKTTALSGTSDMSAFGQTANTVISDRLTSPASAVGLVDLSFKEPEEMPCPSCHSRSEPNDVVKIQ